MPEFSAVAVATEPGSAGVPSEDWAAATADLIVVLDGATARTETGCVHGIAWYAEHLGRALVDGASANGRPRADTLKAAIAAVADLHPQCDLSHPGTPSAGVGIMRPDGAYLVLGDVAIVAETTKGVQVVVDNRVSETAPAERAEVDRYLIGTPEKAAALIPMKRAELAARNVEGGYWIAAAEPAAADHALTGVFDLPEAARVAVVTDGAARGVAFGLMTWETLLNVAATEGPATLIRQVRTAEQSDPLGAAWPRNKASDDATTVVAVIK